MVSFLYLSRDINSVFVIYVSDLSHILKQIFTRSHFINWKVICDLSSLKKIICMVLKKIRVRTTWIICLKGVHGTEMALHKLGCVWSCLACMYIILFWSSNIHLILHIASNLNNMQIINIIYTDTRSKYMKKCECRYYQVNFTTYFGLNLSYCIKCIII